MRAGINPTLEINMFSPFRMYTVGSYCFISLLYNIISTEHI